MLSVCEPLLFKPGAGETFSPGVLSAAAGRAAYDVVVRAVDAAMKGEIEAVATAPVNKEAFRLAGLPWSGHTDLLAHLTGAAHVAMMFHSGALRVVLGEIVDRRRQDGVTAGQEGVRNGVGLDGLDDAND